MLLLNNRDVAELLDPKRCLEALDEAYRQYAAGEAAQFPEGGLMDVGCELPGSEEDRRFTWGAQAGILPDRHIFALRQKLDILYTQDHGGGRRSREKYCIEPGTYCGFIMLVDTRNAEPLALVNDGVLQHLRVAGTAAVAARALSREDSSVLAILGSGGMARDQAHMISLVRPITTIKVYSPTPANRARFAAEIGVELGIDVIATHSPEEAVAGADIVAFSTNGTGPVFPDLSWVEEGMHCTNVVPEEVGNLPERAEVTIVHVRVEHTGAFVGERGAGGGAPKGIRPDATTIGELLIGKAAGRTSASEVTFFHNQPGAGIQFAAVGAELLLAAGEAQRGTEIPTSWFLEDIRN